MTDTVDLVVVLADTAAQRGEGVLKFLGILLLIGLSTGVLRRPGGSGARLRFGPGGHRRSPANYLRSDRCRRPCGIRPHRVDSWRGRADGHRWGEEADDIQWEDARAVLDVSSPTPYSFHTRARGYSKTEDLGGVAIGAMLEQLPAASRLYGLAADKDQGRLLVDSIAGFAARTPGLASALRVDAYRVTAQRSGSTLDVVAADAPGAYGLRPAFLVVDELAQWARTLAPRQLFEATTSAMTKVPGARARPPGRRGPHRRASERSSPRDHAGSPPA